MSAPETNASPITIGPFDVAEKDRLYEFLLEIWTDQSRDSLDRRWWWRFTPPPLLVARDTDDDIVGVCAYIPFSLWTEAGERKGAWIVDYFVRSTHQGRGIGRRLVEAVEGRFEFMASLNQSDAAMAVFARMGWTERSYVSLYICPAPRLARALLGVRARTGPEVNVSVSPAAFGAEFQRLWEACRDSLAPIADRSASYLQNRFGPASGRDYRLITARVNGTLAGYMVMRSLPRGSLRSLPGQAVGLVADYLVDPAHSAVFASLIREATKLTGAHARFLIALAVDETSQRVIRRSGFLGPDTPLIGRRLRRLALGFTATASAPRHAPWYLTPLDCDLDLLWGSNPGRRGPG